MLRRRIHMGVICVLMTCSSLSADNKPSRLEWLQDQALGMFIHWSVDSQLGSVISHSLVGASTEYCERYFRELPESFDPKHFDPDEHAALARLAGMRYAVFTAKHHSGFCMWDTKTTGFGIMSTPYRRDIVRQYIDAFRRNGIAVGLYFSPDDFHFLHRQGRTIRRIGQGIVPPENKELFSFDKDQLRELLTQYGEIDILFLDGPLGNQDGGLKEFCWEHQPNMVITRGALETPEQEIPGQMLAGPWEANFTLGTQWQFKPTNEDYKSGTTLIRMLVETRAKGGNLLLNVGPRPDGRIPIEQEDRIRELALWMFVNREAIHTTRPWTTTHEKAVWYTRASDEPTVYAIVTEDPVTGTTWPYGARKMITLTCVKATERTQVSVLGQNDKVLEYRPSVDPATRWTQDQHGLHISAIRAQRLYNDRKWPNPIVLKITQVNEGR